MKYFLCLPKSLFLLCKHIFELKLQRNFKKAETADEGTRGVNLSHQLGVKRRQLSVVCAKDSGAGGKVCHRIFFFSSSERSILSYTQMFSLSVAHFCDRVS